MTSSSSIRSELDALRAEVEALRRGQKRAARPAPEPKAEEEAEAEGAGGEKSLEDQIRHLVRQAEEMLTDAEDTIATHPVASIAAALALGIVIGRLTAR